TELEGERFNVAPTDQVAAVVEHHGERQLDTFRWGLVPYYAESSHEAARLINARAETVESSGAFRTAFRRRRCIVPADAFYEWRRAVPAAGNERARGARPGHVHRGIRGRTGRQRRPEQRPEPARSADRASRRASLLTILLPGDAMVALVGIAGSGKSTFAQAHFAPTEILSSDAFRGVVADDESDQSASEDAFALLHAALRLRLRRGRLTVVDATNVEEWGRRQLLDIAGQERRAAVAIVLDLPVEVCLERLGGRGVRPVPPPAVRRQYRELRRSLPT